MKRILFVANNPTALSGMTFLISNMKKYSISPILVCEACFYETEDYEVINLTPNFKPYAIQKTITGYYNQKEKFFFRQILKFLNSYHELGVIDKRSRKILDLVKPDAIIVYCDRMGGILQGFIKNAKGIPVIKVPIAKSAYSQALFRGRYFNEELKVSDKKMDINKLPLMINKYWGYTYEGETRLFYPMGYTMAGYLRKMISMYPWISGAGQSTHVLAESENEKKEILSVVQKDVVVTGLVEDYYIIKKSTEKRQIQETIKKKYGIKSDKVIILSVPQMAEHHTVPWQVHRGNMSFVVKEISKIYGQFLISLHPKSKKEDYLFLNNFGNFTFLEEHLRDVIVCADVLVVVSSSSIMHWTDILGISKIVLETDWLEKEISDDIKAEIVSRIQKPIDATENFELRKASIKNVPDEIIRIACSYV